MNLISPNVAAALVLSLASVSADAEKLPAKLFAQHPQYSDVAMSPDGRHLAVTTPVENRTDLMIVDLSGKDEPVRVRYLPNEHVLSPIWTDDDRLVMSKGKKFGFLEAPYTLGHLYSTNLKGEKQEMLFGYQPDDGMRRGLRKDRGYAFVTDRIQPIRGEMLVTFQGWEENDKLTYLYRVNALTGKRELIERLNMESAWIATDRADRPRFARASDDTNNPVLRYRPTPESEWMPVPSSLAGRDMSVWSFAKDNNIAYAEISDKGEPEVFYKVDFAKGTREKLHDHGEYDTGGLLYAGFDPEPFAVYSNLPKLSIQYLDNSSEWAKLHSGLMKQFPGNYVSFEDFSRDNQRILVSVRGDRNPGQYYILDLTKKSLGKILDNFEGVEPTKLAAMRPIEFKNRDGISLSAMLTLPTSGNAPYPMVMLPHGGPHGVSDYWTFDSDVQFLANRGYAVLQVNFQGSNDRGETFMKSTYRKWGTTIMDDIADGTRWAIEQQVADKDRICIYGASFGGYAAMMNPIRYPDLYKCAIGYVGVYDLAFMATKGDINDSKSGRLYVADAVGTDEAATKANSPAHNVEKLKIPVLLVHGKDDKRVPYAHFKAMSEALTKAGRPPEILVKDAEAHGFYKEANRIELYEKMEAFLDKHIGAKSASK